MNIELEGFKDSIAQIFDAFHTGAEVVDNVKFAVRNNKLYTLSEKTDEGLVISFLNPKPYAIIDLPILADPEITINFIRVTEDEIYLSLQNCIDLKLKVSS